jgi:tRNA pseudouridine38-40 synthase
MMVVRYRIDLEYDGTEFWGWQVQPGSRTVQGVLEAAIARIAGEPVKVTGAGRTDRGCHAALQVAHFDLERPREPVALERALGALLPADVQLHALTSAPPGFHARYSATRRAYRYGIARRRSVFTSRHLWPLGEELELASLRQASAGLLGEHDFRGFAVGLDGDGAGSGKCRVERADWEVIDDDYRFTIVADRFLTRMVRLIVGALVEVGRRRHEPEAVAARLDRPPQEPRPAAAPACGLTLAWVGYEGGFEP